MRAGCAKPLRCKEESEDQACNNRLHLLVWQCVLDEQNLSLVFLDAASNNQIHYPNVALFFHSKYFDGVMRGWVFASFNGSSGETSLASRSDNNP